MAGTKKSTAAKTKAAEAEEMTLSQGMQELSEIIRQMEEGGRPLEATFALYKQGLTRLRKCNAQIDRVEKELEILEEGGESE